ncbi:acetyltransferase, GNAT family protein [Pseudooceanicola batsensis HTCC2597]|uniref:Acetyltransferase, GNAT family protein n=1 Tax=Pseudooceanicola batsensis (strain ATCC BAA-863 / DSM 15984 / KCTC 12145 / HTCC2597) TaxID=252305 RepID=A3TTY0_PSEBH|nr:N-acetyltransferase [Pseudooceanicola batsensis]EAQ05107.1 acetyltransferase, GNAT family protein [Pseudooceanicola batsensis HTCC2597]
MNIRPFEPTDKTSVSILLDTAFESPAELRLVETLRAGGDLAIELVALLEGRVVGYVALAHLVSPRGWLSLSPVAVSPSRQERGIGSGLIRQGLDLARRSGAAAVTVLGNPEYYSRFGFTLKAAENLVVEYPKEFFMLYPIAPHTAGIAEDIIYPKAFRSV